MEGWVVEGWVVEGWEVVGSVVVAGGVAVSVVVVLPGSRKTTARMITTTATMTPITVFLLITAPPERVYPYFINWSSWVRFQF